MHNIVCHGCDIVLQLPEVDVGHKAICPRCHTTLIENFLQAKLQSVVCAFCALFMLLCANFLPFSTINIAGINNFLQLFNISSLIIESGYMSISIIFVLSIEILPALCMFAVLIFTLNIHKDLRIYAGKFLHVYQSWCMVEIFFAGVLVSFVKLVNYGNIELHAGFYCYIAFCIFFLRSLQTTPSFQLWNEIAPPYYTNKELIYGATALEQDIKICTHCRAILPTDIMCLRCFHNNTPRKPYSMQCVLALLLTSCLIYVPTNILPIMVTTSLGKTIAANIFTGVIVLYNEKAYLIAIIVFLVSIIIPSFKLIAILVLCIDVKLKRDNSYLTHKLYELVEFVGKWSMVDIFVIVVLTTFIRMDNFMSILPDTGAVLFASVVILTMIAARYFDSRLLWDKNSKT